jgi:hypothetical protein
MHAFSPYFALDRRAHLGDLALTPAAIDMDSGVVGIETLKTAQARRCPANAIAAIPARQI